MNGLYNGILNAQLIGKDDMYNTLVHVFCETIQPYGRLLHDWVSHASLQGDNCQEFFISRYVTKKVLYILIITIITLVY